MWAGRMGGWGGLFTRRGGVYEVFETPHSSTIHTLCGQTWAVDLNLKLTLNIGEICLVPIPDRLTDDEELETDGHGGGSQMPIGKRCNNIVILLTLSNGVRRVRITISGASRDE